MKRLVIVSNRLPYQVHERNKQISLKASSGGLVSAINSYFETGGGSAFSGKCWVGYAGTTEEKWKRLEDEQKLPGEYTIEPVFIADKLYDQYYNGFANSVLWPLFHYFPSYVAYRSEYYDAYKRVNEQFAEKLLQVLNEDDVVWIHDYHLFLLPSLLREKMPGLTIGFFLHIPFPTFEIFRLLPSRWQKELLQGLLGADLVGFHTIEYKRYFLESLQMVLNVENDFGKVFYNKRVIDTDIFPIGIDYHKFRSAAMNPRIIALKDEIRKNFQDRKIIFSLDRLDYTKGVMQRLNGYEKFLESYPEWREKLVMLLNVIPSRDKVYKYKERKRMIEEKVSGVNGKFSSYTWQPIVYFYKHLDFDNLAAAYQAADIALVTPLRDGMNLVSKEYVASRTDGRGALVLSELAGAANELSEAIMVNPTDEAGMAEAIHEALHLSPNRQSEKLRLMQKRIRDYDVNRWVDDFLTELNGIKEFQRQRGAVIFDKDNCALTMEKIRQAQSRLFFFDYDGTLMPFARFPTEAAPHDGLLEKLAAICADPKNNVVIISGRDRGTLEAWLGKLPVTIVAEHGALIRRVGQPWEELGQLSDEWKDIVLPTLQLFTRRCDGSFIEEKQFSLAWHYRNVQAQLGFSRSRELIQTLTHLLANTALQVIDGNKVVEIRTANSNKGVIAQKIADAGEYDFIMALGDDKTDEDMFKALRQSAVTIKIGSGHTLASYNLIHQQDVWQLLDHLISMKCN